MVDDKAILVIYNDKWELAEEGDNLNLSDKDFVTIHFNKMDGETIARIMMKFFPNDCDAMAMTGLFLGVSLQESFYQFLKMKSE